MFQLRILAQYTDVRILKRSNESGSGTPFGGAATEKRLLWIERWRDETRSVPMLTFLARP
jgi:hypothetical protein